LIHVTIELFEVQNIIGVNMAQQVKVLLWFFFGLLNKIIAYVKDERLNLTSLTTTLILVVSCFFCWNLPLLSLVLVLSMLCLKQHYMPQIFLRYVAVSSRLVWKKHKLPYEIWMKMTSLGIWPLGNRSIFIWGFLKDDILACVWKLRLVTEL
jgi:hypothetical protein